jgi:hypothetical protein
MYISSYANGEAAAIDTDNGPCAVEVPFETWVVRVAFDTAAEMVVWFKSWKVLGTAAREDFVYDTLCAREPHDLD